MHTLQYTWKIVLQYACSNIFRYLIEKAEVEANAYKHFPFLLYQ